MTPKKISTKWCTNPMFLIIGLQGTQSGMKITSMTTFIMTSIAVRKKLTKNKWTIKTKNYS